jgi:hypothetical protein
MRRGVLRAGAQQPKASREIQEPIKRNLVQQGHPAVLKYMKFFGPDYTSTVREYKIPLAPLSGVSRPSGRKSYSADT